MRLNRYLANALAISRRKADQLIASGQIKVNGKPAELGHDVKNTDQVDFNGRILTLKNQFTYLLLNKPAGYVCSQQGQGSQTVFELLPAEYRHLKIAGRLDKDSSGLLLLTDDGQLIYDLTHPKTLKTKIYEVQLNKKLEHQDSLAITTGGVTLSDGPSKFTIEQHISRFRTWKYRVTMHEGRKRQIRRTFEALGYQVTGLHRTQIGPYKIADLAPGRFQLLDKP